MASRSSVSELLFLFIFSVSSVYSSGITPSKNSDEISGLSHRELLNRFNYKATKHELVNPRTAVTNPVTTPALSPPNDPTSPGIVSIPSTYPVIASPNPVAFPGTIPPANPVSIPNNNPFNSPLPVTNPVTTPSTYPGVQPVTNPAANPVIGGVPVANPGMVPVVPPGITNAPAIPGQSWCIAKSGAPESALQQALDYSCGIGGADCSMIQDGGSCYNPNSLENHASYAFNSYYQKNPVQTSCDFGGTAMITNVNPSSGSCIYPASGSSSLPSPMTQNPTPTLPTPTTESSTGAAIPGAGTSPPFGSNISNPASGGTFSGFPDSPSSFNTTSSSSPLQPFVCCIILMTSIITGRHILDI